MVISIMGKQKEGNGKFIYENGDFYIGQFSNGIFHGEGILFDKDGEIEYEGTFIYGKKEEKDI